MYECNGHCVDSHYCLGSGYCSPLKNHCKNAQDCIYVVVSTLRWHSYSIAKRKVWQLY